MRGGYLNDLELPLGFDTQECRTKRPGLEELHIDEHLVERLFHLFRESLREVIPFEEPARRMVGLDVDLSPTRDIHVFVRRAFDGADRKLGRDAAIALEIQFDHPGTAVGIKRHSDCLLLFTDFKFTFRFTFDGLTGRVRRVLRAQTGDGIGIRIAQMFLIFLFGRLDLLPQ